MDEVLKDPRFAHVPKDPKFRRIPKNERKVKIDKRFQSMFNDKKFTVKYTIDKRGRPINQTSTENLKKYYDLSSNEDDSDEDETEKHEKINTSKQVKKNKSTKSVKQKTELEDENNIYDNDDDDNHKKNRSVHIGADDDINKDTDESDTSSNSESISTNLELDENEKQLNLRRLYENIAINPNIKKKLKNLTIDYARGEGALFSDSSSDEESSEEEDTEDIEHNWGEMDKDADTIEEITSRLAICNMDWDRIRAVDLMVLLNSFLPPGGLIHSVIIYPSEYGLERLKEEEIKGPIELVDDKTEEKSDDDSHSNDHDDNNSENEEGSEFHREKMRQYQLNRLKYYYAVVVFDSEESANKVYTECDGIEYESTATKLDLRFIPNDMEFDHEPKEVCNKLPKVTKYQPRQFTTTALQQVKVELTWDETKPERKEITQKLNSGKIDDVDDNDIQAYLASGTSDESDVDEVDSRKGSEDNSNGQVKEKENSDPIEKYKFLLKSIEEKEEEKKKKEVELEFTWGLGIKKKTEKLVKEKMKKKENLTPFEQFLEKRKEKKKAKLEEKKKKKISDENEDSSDKEVSDSEDSIPSDVDMNDPYFAEEMQNMKQKNKKFKNKKINHDSENEEEKQRKSELELLMLDKDDGKHHFDMNKIEENQMLTKSKKKRLSKKKKKQLEEAVEDHFEVNVEDPRFSALFHSHYFNIDPADPHYRKTKGTEALINEKLKRRANQNENEDFLTKQPKKDEAKKNDIAALVKMVKKNTKNASKPIK